MKNKKTTIPYNKMYNYVLIEDFFQEVALLQTLSSLKPQEKKYFIGIRELFNGQSNRFIVFEHGKPYSL